MASRRHVAPKGQPSNHGDGIPGRKVPQGLGRNNQWIGFCAVTAAVAIFLFVPFVVFDPPVMAPTGNSDMLNLAGEQQQPSADKLLIYTGRKSTSTSINSHTFPHLGPDSSVYNISVPTLEPLRSFDREKYTIRINTWRRPQILIEIINYYKTCPGVVEIQVVWCDKETEPPSEIYQNSSNFVKVDRREINSLNERFNLSGIGAPTLGIIHVDDDDLFPCITLDHIFFKWTYNPERLVALQPRMHDRKSNAVSLCFLHNFFEIPSYNAASVASKLTSRPSYLLKSTTVGLPVITWHQYQPRNTPLFSPPLQEWFIATITIGILNSFPERCFLLLHEILIVKTLRSTFSSLR